MTTKIFPNLGTHHKHPGGFLGISKVNQKTNEKLTAGISLKMMVSKSGISWLLSGALPIFQVWLVFPGLFPAMGGLLSRLTVKSWLHQSAHHHFHIFTHVRTHAGMYIVIQHMVGIIVGKVMNNLHSGKPTNRHRQSAFFDGNFPETDGILHDDFLVY